jgi:calcineurin-like phosphoesterase family protein
MSNRKKIFFTSDWHIAHEKVIEFSNRPFNNASEMAEGLIKRFNACVSEGSVTYFLGDMGENINDLKKVIDRLNGTKVLVRGNHDKGMNTTYNAGFDVVVNSASLVIANETVTLSHCPLFGIVRENTAGMKGFIEGEHWHGESRHTEYAMYNNNQFHLHGHCHAPNRGKSKVKLGRQWDVGVDGNNYTPVSISQVESWIAKVKREEEKRKMEMF